jgi:AAA family ATP:ADP antiporter
MTPTLSTTAPTPKLLAGERLLASLLRPFARVEAAEAFTAAVMMFTVFCLLMAYYFLKVAREPLILLQGGAEVKSYAAAGQSLLLFLVVPAYAAAARRVARMRLIGIVYGFFALNLFAFAALSHAGARIGVPFYLWVGVFNMTAVAQFWSFANDIYAAEQGKRLFAVLGIGSSMGAVAGAFIARKVAVLGPSALMLLAALGLLACTALLAWVDRRERGVSLRRAVVQSPVVDGPAFAVLLRDRYLLLIAALAFLLNCVNTNGEYVLDRTLLAAIDAGAAQGVERSAFVGAFKAHYFGWVNLISVLLQLFVVSRIMTRLGVSKSLFILPVVGLATYTIILAAPVLALIRIGKIAENSLDYSVQNTVRQALFLVGTRVEKYVGKTAVDTLIVRLGDVFSAALVWAASLLGFSTKAFAALNLGFIACWIVVVVMLGREHHRRAAVLQASAPLEQAA